MRAEVLRIRRQLQYVFQDPYLSLNPRWSIAQTLIEPLRVHGQLPEAEWHARIVELLELVGLEGYHAWRYPHEFSGGQRQRVGIARALAVDPQLVICDEPVSSLDVSVRAQVLNLLVDLQANLGLTYLYISHDLSSVRFVSTRVAVMYLGKIVEIADVDDLFERPRHHYTYALLQAIPVPDPDVLAGRSAAEGRGAERAQHAQGLPLPPALPRVPAALRRDRSRARIGWRRSPRRLPQPALNTWPKPEGEDVMKAIVDRSRRGRLRGRLPARRSRRRASPSLKAIASAAALRGSASLGRTRTTSIRAPTTTSMSPA